MYFLLNGVVCIKTLKLCLISAIFSLFRSQFQSSKEVCLSQFSLFSIFNVIRMFKLLYTFIQVRQLALLLGLFSTNNTFEPRSRYPEKLPAAAANQIAGNNKISLGMHN